MDGTFPPSKTQSGLQHPPHLHCDWQARVHDWSQGQHHGDLCRSLLSPGPTPELQPSPCAASGLAQRRNVWERGRAAFQGMEANNVVWSIIAHGAYLKDYFSSRQLVTLTQAPELVQRGFITGQKLNPSLKSLGCSEPEWKP